MGGVVPVEAVASLAFALICFKFSATWNGVLSLNTRRGSALLTRRVGEGRERKRG